MDIQLIFFYIFAVMAVGGALSVLLFRSPVYCALALVGTFGFLAAIFILLGNEFVAAIQILVYAGAIMVLFLFVIMLLNLRTVEPFNLKWSLPKVLGVVVSIGILAQMIGVFTSAAARLGPMGAYSPERIAQEGAVQIIGQILFTDYVLPFEVISVLLMVAVIGAVVIAKRRLPPPGEEGR
ncbi:MAG TPA: NADH-quinone oxidoreductase subunit J [bacterium]|nr:NADH-quinone oxidoreductase subunit J [bacterium]